MSPQNRLCIGKIASPHGIRGEIKLQLYLEQASLLSSGCPLYDHAGAPVIITSSRPGPKELFLIKVQGITSREQADSLKGNKLYIDRHDLPDSLDEETYYIEDLKGLRVILEGSSTTSDDASSVRAVHNFGAGDILEICVHSKTYYIPFRKEAVIDVNLKEGLILINASFLLESKAKPKEHDNA